MKTQNNKEKNVNKKPTIHPDRQAIVTHAFG
jgi:hypothetical protein